MYLEFIDQNGDWEERIILPLVLHVVQVDLVFLMFRGMAESS